MGELFEAANLKVERAKKHIADLEVVLAEHFAANPTKVTFTEATKDTDAHLRVEAKSPPLTVSAIVGDAVHNLRSALDLMAVELVDVGGGNTNGVYFPFCDTEADLKTIIKKKNFHRAGTDAVDLLLSLKPFKGGNIALRALHDLDVQDKHHTLIPNAALMTTPQLTADAENFPDVKIRLVEGSEPKVLTVFPEDSPLSGKGLVEGLHELMELVKGILEAFASLVAARA